MIVTKYKYFTIRLKNQVDYNDTLDINPDRYREYKLVYQICQYEKLKNQDEKYIKRLRKNGIKVVTQKKKIGNNIVLEYFKEYAKVDKDLKYRQKLVNKILNKEIYKKEFETNSIYFIEDNPINPNKPTKIENVITNKVVNNQEFLQYQNRKNVDRNSDDELVDEYIAVLDSISSYLMCDNKLASCITKDYSNKELSLDTSVKKSIDRHSRKKYTPTPKQKLEDYKRWQEKNKKQFKRWRKSRTYKLNNLYSYTYGKNTMVWDWLKNKWVEHKSPNKTNIKRLIDPCKPHIVKWCFVDTENKFSFNNEIFNLDKELRNYQVKNKAQYIDGALNDFTNESQMEQILCFYIPHEDKYYFFDENIDRINDLDIIKFPVKD